MTKPWFQYPDYKNKHGGTHLNPSTWAGQAGGSEGQSHPRVHSEFKASLRYIKDTALVPSAEGNAQLEIQTPRVEERK